jgi:hypothetical protein
MILIFGFRPYVRVLAVLTLACRHGHVASHRVLKVTRKFTLFFVPVFPVQTRYYTVCAQCGLRVPWNKEEAEAAAAWSGAGTPSGIGASEVGLGSVGGGGGGTTGSPGAGAGGSGAGAGGGSGSVAPGVGGRGSTAPADPVAPPLRPVTSLHLPPPAADAGWYPDPAGEGAFRYWDGAAWTQAVHGRPGS